MNVSARCLVIALVLGFESLAAGVAAAEPDYARETRLSEQIVDMILDGDPVWLEADAHEFLGIYTEADEPRAAVLILHGRGFHPDWADAINPLRVGLVEHGYSTLSLQMPVLDKEAKYLDYVPIFDYAHGRIDAGIEFLRDAGFSRILLLAHSCGVHMAMDWIGRNGDEDIDAYIGLGMGATDFGQPMRQPFPLDQMRVAILDLYGENEYPAVIRGAAQRKEQITRAGHPNSHQQVLPGADHYFTNQDDELVGAVAEWLEQLD